MAADAERDAPPPPPEADPPPDEDTLILSGELSVAPGDDAHLGFVHEFFPFDAKTAPMVLERGAAPVCSAGDCGVRPPANPLMALMFSGDNAFDACQRCGALVHRACRARAAAFSLCQGFTTPLQRLVTYHEARNNVVKFAPAVLHMLDQFHRALRVAAKPAELRAAFAKHAQLLSRIALPARPAGEDESMVQLTRDLGAEGCRINGQRVRSDSASSVGSTGSGAGGGGAGGGASDASPGGSPGRGLRFLYDLDTIRERVAAGIDTFQLASLRTEDAVTYVLRACGRTTGFSPMLDVLQVLFGTIRGDGLPALLAVQRERTPIEVTLTAAGEAIIVICAQYAVYPECLNVENDPPLLVRVSTTEEIHFVTARTARYGAVELLG